HSETPEARLFRPTLGLWRVLGSWLRPSIPDLPFREREHYPHQRRSVPTPSFLLLLPSRRLTATAISWREAEPILRSRSGRGAGRRLPTGVYRAIPSLRLEIRERPTCRQVDTAPFRQKYRTPDAPLSCPWSILLKFRRYGRLFFLLSLPR